MEIGDLKDKIEELADSLQFAAITAEKATQELKSIKNLEISLKKTSEALKEEGLKLEKRVAKTVAENVIKNLDPFFKNSQKIRESAEAIHQANIQIQKIYQKSCMTKSLMLLFVGFIAGVFTCFYL